MLADLSRSGYAAGGLLPVKTAETDRVRCLLGLQNAKAGNPNF